MIEEVKGMKWHDGRDMSIMRKGDFAIVSGASMGIRHTQWHAWKWNDLKRSIAGDIKAEPFGGWDKSAVGQKEQAIQWLEAQDNRVAMKKTASSKNNLLTLARRAVQTSDRTLARRVYFMVKRS